jgi:inositol polyphosphate-4-phosphatase
MVCSFARLANYATRYKRFLDIERDDDVATKKVQIDRLLVRLDRELRARKGKNLDLLCVVEDLSRLLHGARLTCCKSGKDRTAMAVTLEQCNLLIAHHDMLPPILQQALDAMRSVGVRRENVLKNIGEKRYAFNKIQVYALPKLYRPPLGTYGSQIT